MLHDYTRGSLLHGIIYYLFLINVSSTSFSLDNLICTRKRNTEHRSRDPVSCSASTVWCGTTKARPRACGCLRLLHFCCKLNIFIAMTRRVLKLQTTVPSQCSVHAAVRKMLFVFKFSFLNKELVLKTAQRALMAPNSSKCDNKRPVRCLTSCVLVLDGVKLTQLTAYIPPSHYKEFPVSCAAVAGPNCPDSLQPIT